MKKFILIFALMALITSTLAGCTPQTNQPSNTPAKTQAPTKTQAPDTATSASIATDDTKLVKAASKDGTWIIILKKDMTTSKEIVIQGEFSKPNPTDAAKVVPAGRKLALYDQDANRVKTATFTLKAPKLTVKSVDTKIQGGTFVGDVYVESLGFNLVDAKVQGNIYFKTAELKAAFKMDAKSSVTGVQEVKA